MSSDDATAIHAVTEPQHAGHLRHVREHGSLWVYCQICGRQWAIHGSTAEIVSDGDSTCDEGAES